MAVLIDPPAPPLPNPGLLSAAVGPLPLPLHATADGLEYQPDSCGVVHLWPLECEGTPPEKVFDPGDDLLEVVPFVVYASLVCGLAGTSQAEAEGKVRRRLQLKEQYGVERAFWGGTGDVPGYLQTATVDTLTAVAGGGVTGALGDLEQALADNYGLPGLIHVRPRLAAWLGKQGLIRWEGQTPKTQRGNVLVIGDGYSGVGPGGEAVATSTEWMYATGRVVTWRDDVFVPPVRQSVQRQTNEQFLLAERTYAIGVECYIAAINAPLTEPV